jgi:hypothetical protein
VLPKLRAKALSLSIIYLLGRILQLSLSFRFLFHMTKTTQLLTRPAPGTIVKPVYEYDEGQKEKLQALREVSVVVS